MLPHNRSPLIGDLVSLHSPPGDPEVVDLGIVIAVYPKRTAYGRPLGAHTIYQVLGRYGKACEYDEPFWEARVINRGK